MFMKRHAIIALIRDGHDAVGESIDNVMHARPRKETALSPAPLWGTLSHFNLLGVKCWQKRQKDFSLMIELRHSVRQLRNNKQFSEF